MKKTVTVRKYTEEKVEVDFPFYREQEDSANDGYNSWSVWVKADGIHVFKIAKRWDVTGDIEWEISKERDTGIGYYETSDISFEESTEEDFYEALAEMNASISNITEEARKL